jgi:hypothetical protein
MGTGAKINFNAITVQPLGQLAIRQRAKNLGELLRDVEICQFD